MRDGLWTIHPDLSSVNNFMMWRSNKPAVTARDGVQNGGGQGSGEGMSLAPADCWVHRSFVPIDCSSRFTLMREVDHMK
jgi:hypothetical protein